MSKYLDLYYEYRHIFSPCLLNEEDIDEIISKNIIVYNIDIAKYCALNNKQFSKLLKNYNQDLAKNKKLTSQQITKLINLKCSTDIITSILCNCNISFEHFLLAVKHFPESHKLFASDIFENMIISDSIKEKVTDYFLKNEIFK